MQTYLLEMLQCPVCAGVLGWKIDAQDENHIESGRARCTECETEYPVQEGVGVFLTPDLPRNDLWEQVDSGLIRYLSANPELERRLLEPPLEALAPADRLFRSLLLDERGEFAAAAVAEQSAMPGLYTPEYLQGWASQVEYVLARLEGCAGPIVDLASGRGYLVEKLARALPNPLVASDFSLHVLRRDRRWLQYARLDERVSLLAFDARRTPFKDGAVRTLTTNLGLPNIEDPGALLSELRRVVSGAFYAISHFFPDEDQANRAAIRSAGLEPLLYQASALAGFAGAGWQAQAANLYRGPAAPTPAGVVLAGAVPDGLPAAETELTWCTLVAV